MMRSSSQTKDTESEEMRCKAGAERGELTGGEGMKVVAPGDWEEGASQERWWGWRAEGMGLA